MIRQDHWFHNGFFLQRFDDHDGIASRSSLGALVRSARMAEYDFGRHLQRRTGFEAGTIPSREGGVSE
jgi:hypothetical protein